MVKVLRLLYLLAMPLVAQAQDFEVGGAYQCARFPSFVKTLGMSASVAIDTTVTRLPGVVLRELDGQRRLYQHPTWATAGHVGTTVRDQYGNIYVIPVPSIGLDTNPLSARNKVYRISAKTGLMSEFVSLPLPQSNDQSNPFGTVGLALDCQTNSLYVSSLAGSSIRSVAGKIYRIDVASKKVVDELTNVDAIGIGVFNFSKHKRLYFGDARSSSVLSIELTNTGDFKKAQQPRYELSLLNIRNGDSTQVKKIRFIKKKDRTHTMTLSDTEFSFRIQAETNRRFRHYDFSLDQERMKWLFQTIRN